MRAGSLRSLLRDLRAGGVSEYSATDKNGATVTLKLGPLPPSAEHSESRPSAKAAPAVDPESRRSYEAFLASVHVTEAQAAEVLKHVQ
jgi:hypothetical protein